MKFTVDQGYISSFSKVKRKAKTYTDLFDCVADATVGFTLDDKQMQIWCATKYETKQSTYSLQDIRRCEIYYNGCLLLFKDKKCFFLPVTNNEKRDEELLEICEIFESELDGLHFVVIERLRLQDEKTGEKVNVGFSLFDSPVAMIVMGILAIVIASFFVTIKNDYGFVERSACESYVGVFERYHEDSQDYTELHFADGELFWVHNACSTEAFFDKLETVKKGEQLQILINPNVEYVVEIKTETQEILNFETAQKEMKNEALGFMWLGIALYVAAAYLIVYGIYTRVKEKSQE